LGRQEPFIFNIGTRQETSVLALYELMQTLIPTKTTPRFLPARLGEISRSALDVTRVREQLGWQARTPLLEGLRATLAWYRQVVDGSV